MKTVTSVYTLLIINTICLSHSTKGEPFSWNTQYIHDLGVGEEVLESILLTFQKEFFKHFYTFDHYLNRTNHGLKRRCFYKKKKIVIQQ